MRGGRRVVFVSLDDDTGPVANVVFFHDAQERVGGQVFAINYMLVRGRTRRLGAKGVSAPAKTYGTWLTLHTESHSGRTRNGSPRRLLTSTLSPRVESLNIVT